MQESKRKMNESFVKSMIWINNERKERREKYLYWLQESERSMFRYTAVCHPFYYRESLAGRSITSRVLMYVIPVIVISTIINIPKFLETELVYGKEVDTENVTVRYISYDLTELRGDPDYIRYVDTQHTVGLSLSAGTTRTGAGWSSPASYLWELWYSLTRGYSRG